MSNQTSEAFAYIEPEYKDVKGRVELQRRVVEQLNMVKADAGEAEASHNALFQSLANEPLAKAHPHRRHSFGMCSCRELDWCLVSWYCPEAGPTMTQMLMRLGIVRLYLVRAPFVALGGRCDELLLNAPNKNSLEMGIGLTIDVPLAQTEIKLMQQKGSSVSAARRKNDSADLDQ